MKITALKQQVKNPDRVSVFVDGKYSFSLHLNELLEEKLKVGLELDQAQQKDLKKKSDEGKLRMRSMEWLMNRPHSEREFRDYLRRKQVEPDFVDGLVDYFQEKKLLDDTRFAKWLIEVRSSRQKSQRALQAELRSKGVSSEVIGQVFSEVPINEVEQLQKLIQKKRRLARYQDDQKLMQYLARQGYGFDLIRDALVAERTQD